MSSQFKSFLFTFLISLPFWWEINIFQQKIESSFIEYSLKNDPAVFTASVNQQLLEKKIEELKPLRKVAIQNPFFQAKEVFSVYFKEGS